MPDFKNMKELAAYLNKQIAFVMEDEVAEKVKDVQQRNIQEQVYEAYTPFQYSRRRWSNGGLGDRESMEVDVVETGNGVELTVTNRAKGQDDNFEIAELVEYGDGYNGKEYTYKRNRNNTQNQYLEPRPFTAETVSELQMNNEHVTAFKEGLRKRGIDTTK